MPAVVVVVSALRRKLEDDVGVRPFTALARTKGCEPCDPRSLQQRHERMAFEAGLGWKTDQLHEGRRDVEQRNVLLHAQAGVIAGRDEDERYAHALIEQRLAMVHTAVFPELLTVIGGDDHDGV